MQNKLLIRGRNYRTRGGTTKVAVQGAGNWSGDWQVRGTFTIDGVTNESGWATSGHYYFPNRKHDYDIVDGLGPVELSLGDFARDWETTAPSEKLEARAVIDSAMVYHSGEFKKHLHAVRALAQKLKILEDIDNNNL